jgi:uncharacterized protein YfkK (UPF0435 family)
MCETKEKKIEEVKKIGQVVNATILSSEKVEEMVENLVHHITK